MCFNAVFMEAETIAANSVVPSMPKNLSRDLPKRLGHYELLELLGQGGMGVVYLARQTKLSREVALKMVIAGGQASEIDRARFLAEAEIAAGLQHPGIVQIHEFGTFNGLPYYALEYCPNGSLASKLDGTPLPARQEPI